MSDFVHSHRPFRQGRCREGQAALPSCWQSGCETMADPASPAHVSKIYPVTLSGKGVFHVVVHRSNVGAKPEHPDASCASLYARSLDSSLRLSNPVSPAFLRTDLMVPLDGPPVHASHSGLVAAWQTHAGSLFCCLCTSLDYPDPAIEPILDVWPGLQCKS